MFAGLHKIELIKERERERKVLVTILGMMPGSDRLTKNMNRFPSR